MVEHRDNHVGSRHTFYKVEKATEVEQTEDGSTREGNSTAKKS